MHFVFPEREKNTLAYTYTHNRANKLYCSINYNMWHIPSNIMSFDLLQFEMKCVHEHIETQNKQVKAKHLKTTFNCGHYGMETHAAPHRDNIIGWKANFYVESSWRRVFRREYRSHDDIESISRQMHIILKQISIAICWFGICALHYSNGTAKPMNERYHNVDIIYIMWKTFIQRNGNSIHPN